MTYFDSNNWFFTSSVYALKDFQPTFCIYKCNPQQLYNYKIELKDAPAQFGPASAK